MMATFIAIFILLVGVQQMKADLQTDIKDAIATAEDMIQRRGFTSVAYNNMVKEIQTILGNIRTETTSTTNQHIIKDITVPMEVTVTMFKTMPQAFSDTFIMAKVQIRFVRNQLLAIHDYIISKNEKAFANKKLLAVKILNATSQLLDFEEDNLLSVNYGPQYETARLSIEAVHLIVVLDAVAAEAVKTVVAILRGLIESQNSSIIIVRKVMIRASDRLICGLRDYFHEGSSPDELNEILHNIAAHLIDAAEYVSYAEKNNENANMHDQVGVAIVLITIVNGMNLKIAAVELKEILADLNNKYRLQFITMYDIEMRIRNRIISIRDEFMNNIHAKQNAHANLEATVNVNSHDVLQAINLIRTIHKTTLTPSDLDKLQNIQRTLPTIQPHLSKNKTAAVGMAIVNEILKNSTSVQNILAVRIEISFELVNAISKHINGAVELQQVQTVALAKLLNAITQFIPEKDYKAYFQEKYNIDEIDAVKVFIDLIIRIAHMIGTRDDIAVRIIAAYAKMLKDILRNIDIINSPATTIRNGLQIRIKHVLPLVKDTLQNSETKVAHTESLIRYLLHGALVFRHVDKFEPERFVRFEIEKALMAALNVEKMYANIQKRDEVDAGAVGVALNVTNDVLRNARASLIPADILHMTHISMIHIILDHFDDCSERKLVRSFLSLAYDMMSKSKEHLISERVIIIDIARIRIARGLLEAAKQIAKTVTPIVSVAVDVTVEMTVQILSDEELLIQSAYLIEITLGRKLPVSVDLVHVMSEDIIKLNIATTMAADLLRASVRLAVTDYNKLDVDVALRQAVDKMINAVKSILEKSNKGEVNAVDAITATMALFTGILSFKDTIKREVVVATVELVNKVWREIHGNSSAKALASDLLEVASEVLLHGFEYVGAAELLLSGVNKMIEHFAPSFKEKAALKSIEMQLHTFQKKKEANSKTILLQMCETIPEITKQLAALRYP